MAAKAKRTTSKSAVSAKVTSPQVQNVGARRTTTSKKIVEKPAAAVKAVVDQTVDISPVATVKGKKLLVVAAVEKKTAKSARSTTSRSTKDLITVVKPESTEDYRELTTHSNGASKDNPTHVKKGRGAKQAKDDNHNNIENGDHSELDAKNMKGKTSAPLKSMKGLKKSDPSNEALDSDEKIEETAVPVGTKVNNAKRGKTGPKVPSGDNSSMPTEKKAGKRKADESKKVDGNEKSVKEPAKKKQKISIPLAGGHEAGIVLVVGAGDTGQLGLGPDVMDRKRPAKVPLPASCVQVCAGGMHTVCVTESGEVYTFGCNDEGALGRITPDDDECTEPSRVEGLPEKIVQVSAGDSHTAALSETGKVYIWGVFRDANGPLGMFTGPGKLETPKVIDLLPSKVSKIASGTDHLACLTIDGDVYTLGCGEQGQLGRVAECFTVRGGRRGIDLLLKPAIVHFPKKSIKICDIWTGQYGTYAKSCNGSDVYAWGLNNYYQLGFEDIATRFNPVKSSSFESAKDWVSISGGQHHALAIDKTGLVYALGRKDYGRLGLGNDSQLQDKAVPTLIPGLQSTRCSSIACGTAVSYAIGENGSIYSWGMGSGQQLGHGEDEDDVYAPKLIEGKQLEDKRAVMVSAGGQHMVLIGQNRS